MGSKSGSEIRRLWHMARRGENIRKRTDGRWEGRYITSYSDTGKACYSSVYGKTYAEAKEKLKQYKNLCDHKIESRMSMQKLFREWLNMKRDTIKQSSYVKYRNLIENHYIPYFGHMKTMYLTGEHVQDFILEKNHLAEKTVHDLVSLLVQIIKYGQSRQYIRYFGFQTISYPKIPNQELHVLKSSEVTKLVHFMQSSFEIQKIGVLLSLFMGIRLGELCALQWQDVNLLDETIHIKKTMQRLKDFDSKTSAKTKIVIDTPKSQKSIRSIPIPSFLLEVLQKYKASNKAYLLTGTVRYIEPSVYERMFSTYLEEAGIENTNFHALRHTFATRAIEQGFDIKSLSEILGHSSVKFTMERYVHPSEAHKKRNLEKLAIFY